MERAAAVLVGVVGLVLLTAAALAWSWTGEVNDGGGVEVLALQAGAPPGPAAGPQPSAEDLMALVRPATTVPAPSTSAAPAPAGTTPAVTAAPLPVPPEVAAIVAEISGGGIRFDVGHAELDERARGLLDRLAPLLVGRPDVVVAVRGHTDSTGSDEVNRVLSAQRAQAVATYLVARGVGPAQVQAAGVGPAEPVADNATPDGRELNRRSDVVVDGGSS